MSIQVGDRLPEVPLQRIREGVETVDTRTLFDGKKVVLFAVPGAFTPTCSEKHLPGYRASTSTDFRARGIEVACMSVNDPFVMQAWGQSQHVPDGLLMLADGNGDFTRALGLELDASAYGMGTRSKRFALYAEDGVVKQLHRRGAGRIQGVVRRAHAGATGVGVAPDAFHVSASHGNLTRDQAPLSASAVSVCVAGFAEVVDEVRSAPCDSPIRRPSSNQRIRGFAARARATTGATACTLLGRAGQRGVVVEAFDAQFFGGIAAVGAQSGDNAGRRDACRVSARQPRRRQRRPARDLAGAALVRAAASADRRRPLRGVDLEALAAGTPQARIAFGEGRRHRRHPASRP